jgi:hypothetical protein
MEKKIILARPFKRNVEGFLKKRLLLPDDFEAFQKILLQNPEMGDVIVGAGGIRKVRIKSASRGKSGGFRVCYYYVTRKYEIYLLSIYAKNEKENLTQEDKNR